MGSQAGGVGVSGTPGHGVVHDPNSGEKAAGRLSTAGLPNAATITLGLSDRNQVIQEFLQLLAEVPHVEVIPLSGESAIEGLKDQILLRDPAKPKGEAGVKTGGSDSAWIREVLAQAGTPDALLFLSQDRDIKRAFQAWGLGEPLMRTTSTLRPSLFEDVPAIEPKLFGCLQDRVGGVWSLEVAADEVWLVLAAA